MLWVREWPGCPLCPPPPSSPSPQPPGAGSGMMLSSVPLDFQQKGQEQVPGRSIKDPLHHKGCPQRGNSWEVSPPQQLVPRGWCLCPAHPSCPKVMFSLKRRLSSRSSWVMWHHFSLQGMSQCGTTLSPLSPQDPLSASPHPGPRCWRTGRHQEPLGVVLGVG